MSRKNEDELDLAARNTGNKNCKESLLKIVDNDVEKITGLLLGTLHGDPNHTDDTSQTSTTENYSGNTTPLLTEHVELTADTTTEEKANALEVIVKDKSLFSNNIKSPSRQRKPQNGTCLFLKKRTLDSPLDEAIPMNLSNNWTDNKNIADSEVTHSKNTGSLTPKGEHTTCKSV